MELFSPQTRHAAERDEDDRRADVPITQQLLHCPNVVPILEQIVPTLCRITCGLIRLVTPAQRPAPATAFALMLMTPAAGNTSNGSIAATAQGMGLQGG